MQLGFAGRHPAEGGWGSWRWPYAATRGFGLSRVPPAPGRSEAEEIILLGAAAIRLVPVDR